MKIILKNDDDSELDITELVQIAYDVAVSSMDYSSGFLDKEEVDGLLNLALACGFPDARQEVTRMWRERLIKEKNQAELIDLAQSRGARFWIQIEPTTEELETFLQELKAGR